MIDETLAKIEAAIKQVRAADPKEREDLIRLLEKLRADLRAGGVPQEAGLTAVRRALEESVVGYEASHPKLAAVVNEICSLLASVGI